MAKDLVLDVIAKKNSRQLSELADEFDRLATMTDDAGKKMHETGTFSDFLDGQLAKTRTEVKQLGEEFDRTGNKDVYAKLRGSQANLKSLEGIKKDLSKAIDDGGNDGAKSFLSKFKGMMSSGGEGGAGLGEYLFYGLAPAAPLIGGAINAAILLAVAGGGIATGIVAQLHDPQVAAAAGDLKASLVGALKSDTAPFKVPLLNAIGEVKGALVGLIDGINWTSLSKDIQPLADGLSGLIQKMGPGLNSALKASEPLFAALGQMLPAIGKAIGDFFQDMANGGQGATEALRTLLNIVVGTIEVLGKLVQLLSQSYEQIVRFADDATGAAHAIGSWIPIFGQVTGLANGLFNEIRNGTNATTMMGRSLDSTSSSADLLAGAMRDASSAFDTYFGKTMSVDEANIKFKQDLMAMKSAVEQNGKSLKDNTEGGLANRAMLLGLIQDAERTRQSQIDLAGGANASADSIAKANAQYEANIAKLEQMGAQLGLRKSDLDAIVGNYDVNVIYTTTYVERGTRPSNQNDYSQIPTGRIGGRAGGGPIAPDGWSWVGEQGPELIRAGSSGAYVLPNARSGYATPVGASSQGGGREPVVVVLRAGDRAAAALLPLLRAEVLSKGGNVQAVLGRAA